MKTHSDIQVHTTRQVLARRQEIDLTAYCMYVKSSTVEYDSDGL